MPPGRHHHQPTGRPRSRRAGAAPAGSRCRPSAGRRARPAGAARAAASSTVRAIDSHARNREALSSSALGRRHGGQLVAELAEHAGPRVERRRTLVLRAAPDEHGHAHRPGAPRRARRTAGSCRSRARRSPTAKAGCSPDCSSSPTSAASWSSRPTSGQANSVAVRRGTGSRWCRNDRRAGCREARATERGILPQHGGLQRAQLGARLETELLGEQLAHLAQHLERVGLSARAGQGQGTQAPQPFAQRVRRRSAPRARRPPSRAARARAPPRPGPPARSPAAPRAGRARPARPVRPRARRTATRATGTARR